MSHLTGAIHAKKSQWWISANGGLPRALVIGPAGAGKSAMLRSLAEILRNQGREVVKFTPGLAIDELDPDVVLLVDHLESLEPDALEAVIARAKQPESAIIAGVRPWPKRVEVLEISRLLDRSFPPIILGRVTRSDLAEYYREQRLEPSEACLDHLIQVTSGAAWLVSYAAGMHSAAGCDPAEHAELRGLIQSQVAQRIETVAPEVRKLVEDMALAGDDLAFDSIDSAVTRTLGEDGDHGKNAADIGDVITHAYSEGLLLRDGRLPPVVGEAVRTLLRHRMSPGTRSFGDSVAQNFANTMDGSYGEALPTIQKDPRVAEALVAKAEARLTTDPARANFLYGLAGAAGADPRSFVVNRAIAAWDSGDLPFSAALIDTAITAGNAGNGIEDLAATLWSARGMLATGVQIYQALPPSSPESKVKALVARIGSGDVSAATETVSAESGAAPGGVPSMLGTALGLLAKGLASSLNHKVRQSSMADLTRAAELYAAARSLDPIPEIPAVIAANAALGLGDLPAASHALNTALAAEGTSFRHRRTLLLWEALVAVQSEHHHQARLLLAEAENNRSGQPLTARAELVHHAVLVALARRYEDMAALESAWMNALPTIGQVDADLYLLYPLSVLIAAGARLGDAESTNLHIAAGMGLLERLGDPPMWSVHLWWAGIQRGILLNRPDSLAPFATRLARAADHSPVARAMARAGETWTHVLAGKVNPEKVMSDAQSLAAVGLAWDGSRLAGHAASRTENRKHAVKLLACARELHPRDLVALPTSPTSGRDPKASPASAQSPASTTSSAHLREMTPTGATPTNSLSGGFGGIASLTMSPLGSPAPASRLRDGNQMDGQRHNGGDGRSPLPIEPSLAGSASSPIMGASAAEALSQAQIDSLSEREVEIAVQIIAGKTYVEIGKTLYISPRTVEHHVAHIRRRLGATTRADLIAKLRVALGSSTEPYQKRTPNP